MRVGFWVACGIAGLLVAANVITMKRLWASPIFERPQKIAQSVLLWLIPGSFAVVRYAIDDYRPGRAGVEGDSTIGTDDMFGGEGDGGGFGGHGSGGGDGGGGDGTVGGA